MSEYTISSVPLEHLEQIRPLLQQCREKPLRFLVREIPTELDAVWFNQIESWVKGEQGRIFAAMWGGQVHGFIVYGALPWDSRILGHQMGAIKAIICDPTIEHRATVARSLLHHLEEWAIAEGNEFLLCKVYTDDIYTIHALEQQGFILVDTLLDYVYDFRQYPLGSIPIPSVSSRVILRQAEKGDLSALMDLAGMAFQGHFGRYHADRRIGHRQATAVYQEWVKSSMEGYADWIVVAEVANQIAGYSIWRKPAGLEQTLSVKVGHYSIAATRPDLAGQGLFSILTRAGMELLSDHCNCIEGPTHINNYPVQRGYTALNWRIADTRHSFHKWLQE